MGKVVNSTEVVLEQLQEQQKALAEDNFYVHKEMVEIFKELNNIQRFLNQIKELDTRVEHIAAALDAMRALERVGANRADSGSDIEV